jgi:hypothetical protein
LVEELYGEIRNFSLYLETKRSYEIPGIGGQRGYVSLVLNMQKEEKKEI